MKPALPLKLELLPQARGSGAHVAYLKRHLIEAYRLLKPPLQTLSIAIVGDKPMADLHQQFMNIPGPTDVLTFELDHNSSGRVIDGEIVICLPEARRNAGKSAAALRRELLLYALHGLLHLSGYDDKTPAAYNRMHRKEDRVLTLLGVGAVFSAGAATAAGATNDFSGKVGRPRRGKRRAF